MTSDFRVEKKQQPVVLFMADGSIFEATVFLATYAMHHSGEQTVFDLLQEEDLFLPAKTADGQFHLICKGMICHARCQVEPDPGLEYTDCQVKIFFLGGEVLQGTIKMDMLANSARLSDYINDGTEFFPLFAGEHAHLVNRSLVRNVVLID
ncbi:hypothetical protein [Malonomonas rubra]|uniref:hypothetical protein n=1 Tax=Malonomonas rubra TaxID=57040 RepID=UPI0026EBF709|nr:hypothetical protein [Malonomonas rubra]